MIQKTLSLPTFDDFKLQSLVIELKKAWNAMANDLSNGIVLPLIAQDSQPTLAINAACLWIDTSTSKYYLVANFDGLMKKTEMT